MQVRRALAQFRGDFTHAVSTGGTSPTVLLVEGESYGRGGFFFKNKKGCFCLHKSTPFSDHGVPW